MTELNVTALESLELKELQALLRSNGPCVTLLLPPTAPAPSPNPWRRSSRPICRKPAAQLTARKVPESNIQDLLAPLEDADARKANFWQAPTGAVSSFVRPMFSSSSR